MDAEEVPIWYVFNQSAMGSLEQPERLYIKTLDMRDLIPYVPEPPTCTMQPDGYYGEQYGIYKCSNCGELWQFECDGPKEHGWKCCPHCRAEIKEEAE